MIAESNVVKAACEPEAVVRSSEEIPAPAVVFATTDSSVNPEAAKAAAVVPDRLMPAAFVLDKVTADLIVEVLAAVEATAVPLIPVRAVISALVAAAPLKTISFVDTKDTLPALAKVAVTPVSAVLALILLTRSVNLLLENAISAEPATVAVAVTVAPDAAAVEYPAFQEPV